MNDYYTKKKDSGDNPLSRTLATWSLITGIVALPSAIIPTVGIIVGAIACTLAILSFYNGDGYHPLRAKIGIILGAMALVTSFFLAYAVVYTMNHLSDYRALIQSVNQ